MKKFTKQEAIDYLFKSMYHKVKCLQDGSVWCGVHQSSVSTVILDIDNYNSMPDCNYIVLGDDSDNQE